MKKIIFLTVFAISISTVFGQCSSLFSFTSNFESISFSNQSTVSNAHYFWNFGDGTGSNKINPMHKFPESGKYHVTLFAKDTVSNCSSYFDYRINVVKFSNDICQPDSILDSISYNGSTQILYLNIIDKSLNCNNYSKQCEAGVNSMMPSPAWLGVFNMPARYVSRINYGTFDSTINQYVDHRKFYETIPFRYNSAKNYNNCSANFEFNVVSHDANGQRILFTAMNKMATTYNWLIDGMTSTISSTNDTVSFYFPFNVKRDRLFMAILSTTGSSGCKDTLQQTILVRDTAQTITGIKEYGFNKLSLNIYPNPTTDKIVIGNAIEVERITLINPLGQEVFVLNKPKLKQEIDVSQLPTGIYFLKAESKQERTVYRVVKE